MLKLIGSAVLFALSASSALAQEAIPQGVVLVKGAWSSASDNLTPLPESGRVAYGIYDNDYFRLSLALPKQWTQRYSGPPPSDSGYMVLAQLEPVDDSDGSMPAHVLIAAQDLFFSMLPANNALEQIRYTRDHLAPNYKIESAPSEVRIANRSFARFDYKAPAAGLHWRILATQVRCHVVQFIITSRDPKIIDQLNGAMNGMKLPQEAGDTAGAGGGDAPVCIKDYATSGQRIGGEDPILSEQRFNAIPVRIIIDTNGNVKHIHFLSAFPGQASVIYAALSSWQFKPYLIEGHPVEVETGIMFGRAPAPIVARTSNE